MLHTYITRLRSCALLDAILSFSIDSFPSMDPEAMELFYIQKVQRHLEFHYDTLYLTSPAGSSHIVVGCFLLQKHRICACFVVAIAGFRHLS